MFRLYIKQKIFHACSMSVTIVFVLLQYFKVFTGVGINCILVKFRSCVGALKTIEAWDAPALRARAAVTHHGHKGIHLVRS